MSSNSIPRFFGLAGVLVAVGFLNGPAWETQAAADQAPAARVNQAEQSAEPPVAAEPKELKIGYIRPTEIKKGFFRLRNTGTQPLRISDVRSSCQCVTASAENDLIPPGGEGVINVEVEGQFTLAKSRKAVQVFFEGYRISTFLTVDFEVSYPIHAQDGYVHLDKNRSGAIRLSSIDGKPFTVLAANGEKPRFRNFDSSTDEPRSTYSIEYDFSDKFPLWWILETDHPECPLLPIPVIAREISRQEREFQMGDIRAMRNLVLVGLIEPGGTFDFEFETVLRASEVSFSFETPDTDGLIKGELVAFEPTQPNHYDVFAQIKIGETDYRGVFARPIHLIGGPNLQTRMWIIGKVVDSGVSNASAADAGH